LKTVLSVDVAKNKSMIMLMNSDGEIFIDAKEIKHNLENFEKIKEEIKEETRIIIYPCINAVLMGDEIRKLLATFGEEDNLGDETAIQSAFKDLSE